MDEHDAVDQVRRLIDAIARTWNEGRVTDLEQLWETTDSIYYVAEEGREPFIGIDAVREYWRMTAEVLDEVRVRLGERVIQVLAPDIALAYYPMDWTFRVGRQHPLGGHVRVTLLARRGGDGWRLFHYQEAPVAAMTQLRMAMEQKALPLDATP
jgi:uncharacterized protein (TIGR02246 family)